jgi:exopolysaccharide production protein ExoQ
MSHKYRIAASFFLLSSTSALGFIDRELYGDWLGKPGDKFTQAINALTIAASLLLYWWGTNRQRGPRFNRILPLTAAGLLVASILWSVTPDVTTTRSIAYLFIVVGAIGTVETLDTDEVMNLSAIIAGLCAAVSLLLYFAARDTVFLEYAGFRGVFEQKNPLGQAMMVGVIAGLHGLRVGGRRRFRCFGVIVLCTIVAVMSQSATSLLAILAAFTFHIIGGLYIKSGGRRLLSLWLAIVAGLGFILLMTNIDLMLTYMDKDPTLTGRTDLWPYVIDAILQKPFLGWGFTAFWSPLNPAAERISSLTGWNFGVVEAHNGLLELLLDIGIFGTVFILFLWTRNLVLAVKCMNGPAPQIGVSSLLFLIAIVVIGVSEQVLVTSDGPTVQFFLLGFMCEKELWLARRAWSGPALRSVGELYDDRFGIREKRTQPNPTLAALGEAAEPAEPRG